MYVIVARYYAKEGKDDEIAAILREMSQTQNSCASAVFPSSFVRRRRTPFLLRFSSQQL